MFDTSDGCFLGMDEKYTIFTRSSLSRTSYKRFKKRKFFRESIIHAKQNKIFRWCKPPTISFDWTRKMDEWAACTIFFQWLLSYLLSGKFACTYMGFNPVGTFGKQRYGSLAGSAIGVAVGKRFLWWAWMLVRKWTSW